MQLQSARLSFAAALLIALPAWSATSCAQTLEKVRSSRTITLGYYDFQVPLSYVDFGNKPIGYQLDICHAIVESVRSKIGRADIDIRYAPMTNASDIPLLANGTIDLACGGQPHTTDRAHYVAFTNTTFLSRFAIVSRKERGYETIQDLKGKSIAFTTGTLASKRITDMVLREGLGITLIPTKSPSEAFKLFESKQVDAYVATETTLSSLVARSKNGPGYLVSKQPVWIAPMAIMIRKNDPELKQLADAVIADLFGSGRMSEIYSRWFEAPIPPDNIVLRMEMRPEFKKLIAHPKDSPRATDYE